MTTKLSNLFIADYYEQLAPLNSPELSNVYQSGVVVKNPLLDRVANLGQGTAEVSYWQDLDADEAPNITTDNPDTLGDVGSVGQNSLRARTLYLNKGYGVMDLAAEIANSAPMQQIRNRFGTYWTRQWQRYLIGAARGVVADSAANHDNDLIKDAGATITATDFIDAAYTAGDAVGMFAALGVHSAVMSQMVKADLIDFIPDSNGNLTIPTYLGKPIFVDDALLTAEGKYLSMFYGAGAFGFGEGTPTTPVELERRPAGGNGGGGEVLWERKTYILQPAGYSWVGEDKANLSPTAADYADATNWTRKFDRKQIPFAAVISGTAVGG